MNSSTYNNILKKIREIINCTKWENHVFAVGGCVRDYIRDCEIKDIDLVVDLPNGGIEFVKWLENNGYVTGTVVIYENFGTAMFHLSDFPDFQLEAVHTRKECYRDAKSRNPETSFGTMKEDWTRRDFTINAIYYDISNMKIIDFYNRGVTDIDYKIIRTCGDPEIIFSEDPLRILRMVRFSARFDYRIDFGALQCAIKCIDKLDIISKERITDEFTKMLTYSKDSAKKSLCLLWDLGAFKYIFPCFHHHDTLTKVNIINNLSCFYDKCVINSVEPTITEILANLLYNDYNLLQHYGIKYYLLEKLRYSNDVVNEVIFLIENAYKLEKIVRETHMCYVSQFEYLIRKIMNDCGSREKFLYVTLIGSELVTNTFHTHLWFTGNSKFTEFDKRDSMFYTYKLPIDGNDVMEICQLEPSPEVKKILENTFLYVCVNPTKYSREDCLEYLKSLKMGKELWGEYVL